MLDIIDIEDLRALRDELGDDIVRTPVLRCAGLEPLLGNGTRIFAKLEFLQRTGTFKARGALATLRGLGRDELAAGVTAVSAGNHAVATAFAAKVAGASAKVVMLAGANAARVDACRRWGAEIVAAGDVHEAFETARQIQEREGRYFVHPFEGPYIAAATGTISLEIDEQCGDFDALLVPIGGGGLMAGMAHAMKRLRPAVEVIGVEPEGADTMARSFAAGEPRGIDRVRTIADSLGAPYAMPFSFNLCRQNVDRLVTVSDDDLRRAMGRLFRHARIAVEPACAATTAALFGPLRDELAGRRVVLVFCGSNIDWATFEEQVIFEEESC